MKTKDTSQEFKPLIVVLGETASGKSALALHLAQRLCGEIICADSRTVYKRLSISTAKPTTAEQKIVPHYGLDLIEPDENYNAALFKTYAQERISSISHRGVIPILVGGSGMYIDAVLYDYEFRDAPDQTLHLELQNLGVQQLQQRLHKLHIALPVNSQNPRHLVRQLETGGQSTTQSALRHNTLVLGIRLERTELLQRVTDRVDIMLNAGLVDEIRTVSRRYGWDAPGLQAPAYRAFRDYIQTGYGLEDAKQKFIRYDMNLAKRQRTWFRRNKSIHWLSTEDKLSEAVDIATTFLNK